MTSTDHVLRDLLGRLRQVRQTSKRSWVACCPAHDDRHPSLSVSQASDGTILLHCFSGCTAEAIVRSLGLQLRDLFPMSPTIRKFSSARAAVQELVRKLGGYSAYWVYRNAQGHPIGVVLRWDLPGGRKEIRPVSRQEGGWVVGAMPKPRPLYRLPELLAADPAQVVWVVEGEKCVEVARSLGLLATTSSGGAQAAALTDWTPLRGRNVVICPDNDEAGRKYAQEVARLCQAAQAASVRILDLARYAQLPPGADIADLVKSELYFGLQTDAPHGPAELVAALYLRAQEAPVWSSDPKAGPELVRLSEIPPRDIPWLWYRRIPAGRLSLLVGRPGAGKSFLVCDLAARVSTGGPWPDSGYAPQGDVLLLSAEDDPADTLRPRLDAAGADCSRIHLLQGTWVEREGQKRFLQITLQDVEVLQRAVQRLSRCRLVVVDPVGSYLGAGIDAHRDNEVRGALLPLLSWAAETEVAVLIVCHVRKAMATYADDLTLGSRAFVGMARSVWHVISDQEDKERKLLLSGKCNLCAPPLGLAFRIQGLPPRLEWEPDPVDLHVDDLVSGGLGRGRPTRSVQVAEDFLRDALKNGPKNFNTILSNADQYGITERTLRRAARNLGVEIRRARGTSEGATAGTIWELPQPTSSDLND